MMGEVRVRAASAPDASQGRAGACSAVSGAEAQSHRFGLWSYVDVTSQLHADELEASPRDNGLYALTKQCIQAGERFLPCSARRV
mmetsp:Transcript_55499/g.159580  ORF Transcript_55499/g.159580 Transcript_55499/m.159580 type:complete len:85 (-) Transcript_55499:33-287(-)